MVATVAKMENIVKRGKRVREEVDERGREKRKLMRKGR